MRLARQYCLVDAADCDPPHGLDLSPGGRDEAKVARLGQAFLDAGFDQKEPALVGYPLNGRVQLLTGTHRHEAARQIPWFRLPVTLFLRSEVEAAWGTPRWQELIADIPVEELELREVVEDGRAPLLEERVALL